MSKNVECSRDWECRCRKLLNVLGSGDTDVEIIEIAVSEGDVIEAEDTLITLESDKASMDVPAPKGGKVVKVLVKEGDKVSEGDDIVELEVEGGGESDAEPEAAAEDRQPEADAPAFGCVARARVSSNEGREIVIMGQRRARAECTGGRKKI